MSFDIMNSKVVACSLKGRLDRDIIASDDLIGKKSVKPLKPLLLKETTRDVCMFGFFIILLFISGGNYGGPGVGPGGGGVGKSPCHPNPCMNGGSCTENAGGYDCACTTQYSGPNCESKYKSSIVITRHSP